jgi:mono/diheme cytochrome c family protein
MNKIIFVGIFLVLVLSNTMKSQDNTSAKTLKNGQAVYSSYCQSCHMEDGAGLPGVFPSLVKTGNLKDPNRLVKIILQGMRGPLTVDGEKYNGEMAPTNLTNQEVADVINYIRNTWGNQEPIITAKDVEKGKQAVVKNYTPY